MSEVWVTTAINFLPGLHIANIIWRNGVLSSTYNTKWLFNTVMIHSSLYRNVSCCSWNAWRPMKLKNSMCSALYITAEQIFKFLLLSVRYKYHVTCVVKYKRSPNFTNHLKQADKQGKNPICFKVEQVFLDLKFMYTYVSKENKHRWTTTFYFFKKV